MGKRIVRTDPLKRIGFPRRVDLELKIPRLEGEIKKLRAELDSLDTVCSKLADRNTRLSERLSKAENDAYVSRNMERAALIARAAAIEESEKRVRVMAGQASDMAVLLLQSICYELTCSMAEAERRGFNMRAAWTVVQTAIYDAWAGSKESIASGAYDGDMQLKTTFIKQVGATAVDGVESLMTHSGKKWRPGEREMFEDGVHESVTGPGE